MHKSFKSFVRSIAAAVAIFGASQTFAGYTTVKPAPVGEASCDQILSHLYGGTFTSAGKHFTNGSVTAYRVEDTSLATGSMNIPGGYAGGSADQEFNSNKLSAKAVARFSLNDQSFGTDVGGGFNKLFDVGGYGYSVTGNATLSGFGDDFCFMRSGSSGTQSSENSENADARDHAVTYCIEGLNETRWVMFWEDLNLSPSISKKRSSADFNDLVVELRALPNAVAVPLPAAVWPGISMLAGCGLIKKFRRVLC